MLRWMLCYHVQSIRIFITRAFSFQTLAFRSVTRNCHLQFLDPYLETPGRYSPYSRLRADK